MTACGTLGSDGAVLLLLPLRPRKPPAAMMELATIMTTSSLYPVVGRVTPWMVRARLAAIRHTHFKNHTHTKNQCPCPELTELTSGQPK